VLRSISDSRFCILFFNIYWISLRNKNGTVRDSNYGTKLTKVFEIEAVSLILLVYSTKSFPF